MQLPWGVSRCVGKQSRPTCLHMTNPRTSRRAPSTLPSPRRPLGQLQNLSVGGKRCPVIVHRPHGGHGRLHCRVGPIPARSKWFRPLSNCVYGDSCLCCTRGVFRVPQRAVLDHGIEDNDQFAHTGCQSYFFRLAGLNQALVKGSDDWIML